MEALQSFWCLTLRACGPSHTPGFSASVIVSAWSSLALVSLLKKSIQLLLAGGLLLLHQVSMTFGDTPAVRCGHGGAEGATRRRLELLPIVAAGPKEREVCLTEPEVFRGKYKKEKKEVGTWLCTRAWCASPVHCPSCHACQSRQAGNPVQAPALPPGRGRDKVQTRSSHRCNEYRHCTLPGHISACPIW